MPAGINVWAIPGAAICFLIRGWANLGPLSARDQGYNDLAALGVVLAVIGLLEWARAVYDPKLKALSVLKGAFILAVGAFCLLFVLYPPAFQ